MFAPDGDGVENRESGGRGARRWMEVLVIGGCAFGMSHIARYGPFVMNPEAEIHQAFADYRRGRMGAIKS